MAFMIIFFYFFLQFHPSFMAADEIAINCGSAATSAALDGREWIGDASVKLSFSAQLKGSSITSISTKNLINVDQVPYGTARISRAEFSYSFRVNPGEKFIRLHFNPVSYRCLKKYKDLFNVEIGPFTLLGNFSASLTADAIGEKHFVKDFCISVEQNQILKLEFSPQSDDTYAFINGIEIISLPNGAYYTHDGDLGAQVIGQKSLVFIDNSIALEMIHQSSYDDSNLFTKRDSSSNPKSNKKNDFTWNITVDVGFGYLVRLYFYELQLSLANTGRVEFIVLIDNRIVETTVRGGKSINIPQYRDYVVMMKGHKHDAKQELVIDVKVGELTNEPLKGFEIFKISNPDNSLASTNPSPPSLKYTPPTYAFTSGLTLATIILVSLIAYKLQEIKEATNSVEESSKTPPSSVEGFCRRFSLAEILSATENFKDEFLIGRGGFGKVYKGSVGQEFVAVKKLNSDSMQGSREFWTEVETLSQLRHVHLVSLIGYCNENREMILVYQYMPNGTLSDHLYNNKIDDCPSLSWEKRLRICVGASRGLEYLHTGTNHGVIHRDVKSSNILLDENFVAKISDFGLAKVGEAERIESYVTTDVKGTFGYLDPNYFLSRKLTRKTDVYAFGVVLLEVVCGRSAVDSTLSESKRGLTMWARDYIDRGEFDQIVAPDLRGKIQPDSLELFVEIAEKCLHVDKMKRPTMAQIVAQLEILIDQHERTKSLLPREIASDHGVYSYSDHEMTCSFSLTQTTDLSVDEQNMSPRPKKKSGTDEKMPWTWAGILNRGKIYKKKLLLLSPEGSGSFRRFEILDILAATVNFDEGLVITSNDLYKIYKGFIKSYPKKVAIQRVKCTQTDDALLDIGREIGMLSHLNHTNLTSVIGYCHHANEMITVYDYIGDGALYDYIYGNKNDPLSWKSRLQICIGVARGLRHLHRGTKETIVHQDVRPANIFLDKNFAPKLINVGFSNLLPAADLDRIVYSPPEFVRLPQLNEKSDAFSFGLVLLELIWDVRTRSDEKDRNHHFLRYLPREVRTSIQEKTLHEMIDPDLRGKITVKSLSEFLKVALSCLLDQPKKRPSMDKVLEGLKLALEAQETVTVEAVPKKGAGKKNAGNSSVDLANLYPELSFLKSKTFQESVVFDSFATYKYDGSLSR